MFFHEIYTLHVKRNTYFVMFVSPFLADPTINVAIGTDPPGTPVNGLSNTFDYSLLTSIRLFCNATPADGSPLTGVSYNWHDSDCYTSSHGVQDSCFYSIHTTGYNITSNSLRPQDAGKVTCTVSVGTESYTSDILTLRISGE